MLRELTQNSLSASSSSLCLGLTAWLETGAAQELVFEGLTWDVSTVQMFLFFQESVRGDN
jgi:hypothetical protein